MASVSPLLLYSAPWALFPRRVQIYLIEKGIPESAVKIVSAEFTPAGEIKSEAGYPPITQGSMPQLAVPSELNRDGHSASPGTVVPDPSSGEKYIFIRQSMAIINYIEELAQDGRIPGLDVQEHKALREMRGRVPLERAQSAEILAIAEEISMCFGYWGYLSTDIGGASPDNLKASKLARSLLQKRLNTAEKYFEGRDLSFLDDEQTTNGSKSVCKSPLQFVSIGDCALFAILQFAKNFYGRDIVVGLPNLTTFYNVFETRKSAQVRGVYPEEFQKRASNWLEGTTEE